MMKDCIDELHERVMSLLHQLPEALLQQIALFLIEPSYRLCDWMKDHVVWSSLSGNPRAMDMLYADMRETDLIQKGQKKVRRIALS